VVEVVFAVAVSLAGEIEAMILPGRRCLRSHS
jgi:hypothetical protein